MRRSFRQRTGQAVSLFAFQDIMMAVMGVLILVALLLALQLTQTVMAVAEPNAQTPTATPADPNEIVSEDELTSLRQRAEQMRERYDQAMEDAQKRASLSGDPAAAVEQAVADLRKHYREIESLREQVEARREELDEQGAPASTQAKSLRTALETLKQEQRELRGRVEHERRNPRLTYLIDEAGGRQPLLIELAGGYIRIGRPEQEHAAVSLSADSLSVRKRQLRVLLDRYSPSDNYVVLLVKPSAFGQFDEMHLLVRGEGFEAGTEPVPESLRVLGPAD